MPQQAGQCGIEFLRTANADDAFQQAFFFFVLPYGGREIRSFLDDFDFQVKIFPGDG